MNNEFFWLSILIGVHKSPFSKLCTIIPSNITAHDLSRMKINNVMGLKANKLIMEAAMAGHGEGRGAIELNYSIVGCYLLAHIVRLDRC